MANLKEIVSEMKTISAVIFDNSNEFYIPDFQRNFVWGREEILKLFDDFQDDTEGFSLESSSLEGYLLGNIVLIASEDSNKKIVVDGQQRLTTLSLISKAIYNVLSEKIKQDPTSSEKWIKRIGDIPKGYSITNDDGDYIKAKIQHDPSLGFGKYYNKLITDENDIENYTLETSDDENVKSVYEESYNFINELSDDQLVKFIAYFKGKVKLIITTAPTEAKAFQLFEILNDRGRSLEPMDLIKNHFLKILTSEGKNTAQINDFNSNWRELISNLKISDKKQISSTTFLKQFLIAFKGVNIKAEKMFEYIKSNKSGLDDGDEVLKFVENMKNVSSHYKKIEMGDYSTFNNDNNMYIIFRMLSIKQFHPLLMLFYNDTNDNKARVIDSIARFGAAVLFSSTQTNYIEKILPDLCEDYRTLKAKKTQKPQDAVDQLIDKIENYTKEKAELAQKILMDKNFVAKNGSYNSKALLVLEFIELYFNKNNIVMNIPKGKKLTAEHILSKKIDMTKYNYADFGMTDEKEFNSYVHRIGNLTLLYNTDNSSQGNGKYDEKKDGYKLSDFIMTSTLVVPKQTTVKNGMDTKLCANINKYEKQYATTNGHWTKNNIIDRGKDVAELVKRILTQDI